MIWRVERGAAWELLAALAAEELALAPLPAVACREGGKPWFPTRPELHFNLSHSEDLALCVLSEREVGCDLEKLRPRRPGLPAYALGKEELTWLEEGGGGWERFYTLWTLKEAKVKCTGQGLRLPPREIAVPLLEPGAEGEWEGFRFTALVGDDWRGALCERLT